MNLKFVKPEIIDLKKHPHYNEKWLQAKIEEDPSILGLGNLEFLKTEIRQAGGGRLDTLLVDRSDNRRYEVEIQLGPTDESHIIRTIEYWDKERKRYPMYEHCAVIVAEDITSRFLNVISLFNGHIPLIAIQVKAVKIEDTISLFFTKVIDEQKIATEEDDVPQEPTNEEFWIKKSSKENVHLVKQFVEEFKDFFVDTELKYNKWYIGLQKNNKVYNFVTFEPGKKGLILTFWIAKSEQIDDKLEASSLSQLTYDRYFTRYRVRVKAKDLIENRDILYDLTKEANERWQSLK